MNFLDALRSVAVLSLTLPAAAAAMDAGVYSRCAACHLANGAGVPGAFPNLTNRLASLAVTKQGREYLILVVQAGLIGPLKVGSLAFNGVMPAQGTALSPQQIASTLNYVLAEFNSTTLSKGWKPFSAEEVATVRARYVGITGRQVLAMRPSAANKVPRP